MQPFKPSQSLTEIRDILLPEVRAITDGYPGVHSDLEVSLKANLITLQEWKDGFPKLGYSVAKASLESSAFMDQFFMDQVSGLARIVVDQMPPPSVQNPVHGLQQPLPGGPKPNRLIR